MITYGYDPCLLYVKYVLLNRTLICQFEIHSDSFKLLLCVCVGRFAKYYKMENGTDYRTLVKAYAIRFDVLVNGNVSVSLCICWSATHSQLI